MSEDYYFFFSYASANHANAQWVKPGLEGNHLDEFFEALCRAVSDQVAHQADQVAYRDVKRISMGDFWGQELAEGLQKSRILIALISPHYLKSYNCGRELGFFNKRLQEFRQRAEHNVSQPYRILPLFWENVDTCLKSAHPSVARFLRRYNFTEEGMPATYPAKGLKQICEFRTGTDYEQMYNCIARRIVHLAENSEELPKLSEAPERNDFTDLESIYEELKKEGGDDVVLSGPTGANVIYVVGTRLEMQSVEGLPVNSYAEERERWLPFPEWLGATVEVLTTEGANQAGVKKLCNIELPDNIKSLIESANHRNSPVLLVLDRCALSLQRIRDRMITYPREHFENCGLVTAGGSDIADKQVKEVFGDKYISSYPHHRWNIPKNRGEYVDSVAIVLSGMKKQLRDHGTLSASFTSASMPGLSIHSGD